MKHPRRVRLDFVAPPAGTPRLGAALCVVGLATAVTVALLFDGALTERNRLDAAVTAISQPRGPHSAADGKAAEEAQVVERELSIPWSRLLTELESAAKDTADKALGLAQKALDGSAAAQSTANQASQDALKAAQAAQQAAADARAANEKADRMFQRSLRK